MTQKKTKTSARTHLNTLRKIKFFKTYTMVGVLVVAIASAALFSTVHGDTKNAAVVSISQADVAQKSSPTAAAQSAAAKKDAAAKDASSAKSTAGAQSNSANAAATPATPAVVALAKPSWTTKSLYVDPYNSASTYAANGGGNAIARMGQQPVSRWFGSWNSNVNSDVNSYVASASAARSTPVLVLYNIPGRDCGSYSAGGSASSANYLQWVRQVAVGLAGRSAVVILEPDALAGADCLSSAGQQDRYQTLGQAVTILKAQPNAAVYIDAGNPNWQSAATMAARLNSANIAAADGFSLNVSNFVSTSSNVSYGEKIAQLVGGKHYVIDTSRNGGNANLANGPFNPPSAALGQAPTTKTASSRADGYLWIKTPWESDGPVNGGPNAGEPFWSYAQQLATNAGW